MSETGWTVRGHEKRLNERVKKAEAALADRDREIERLREALNFYAHGERLPGGRGWSGDDDGVRARAALAPTPSDQEGGADG